MIKVSQVIKLKKTASAQLWLFVLLDRGKRKKSGQPGLEALVYQHQMLRHRNDFKSFNYETFIIISHFVIF